MFHDQRPDSLRGMAAGGNRGVFSSSIPGPREQASLSPSRAMPTVLSASSYRPSSGHSSGMLPPPQPPLAQRLSTDTISPGIGAFSATVGNVAIRESPVHRCLSRRQMKKNLCGRSLL
jgi:hypothetical protein